MITEDEFDQWRDNPVTEKFRDFFSKGLKEAEEQWIAALLDDGPMTGEELVRLRLKLQASIKTRLEVVHLDYEDIEAEHERSDEQHERNQPD